MNKNNYNQLSKSFIYTQNLFVNEMEIYSIF